MSNISIEDLKALVRQGKSQEEVLHFLYLHGVMITTAIVMVRALFGISLAEAKCIVTSSVYWSDVLNENEKLHDACGLVVKNNN